MAQATELVTGDVGVHAVLEAELVALFRRGNHGRVELPHGISLERSAYALMVRLRDEGPQRASVLASGLGLDLSTVSRQVSGLVEDGYVVKTADPHDGRASVLALSRTGRSLVERCRAARRGQLRDLLASWDETDVATLARLLCHLNADMARLHETGERR